MTLLRLHCVIVFFIASVSIADSCTLGNYDRCPNWPGCSKNCGGGRHCRTCESCAWYIDKEYCENCNEFCYNGHSFQNGRCQCPSWRYGECCEGCRHIYIPHCVSGQQQCGGSPDGIMCTQCEPGYHSGGYNQGCQDNDECAAGISGCAQQCTNTQGAYVCSCLAGYVLGADKHTCNFRCGNVLCPNGYSFVNGRCQCPAWRSGDCCEVCRHISIPNCVSGQQQCSGSPDGIMCTQCEPGYHSGGYNQGCIDDTCTFESADHCTWTEVPSGDDFDWTLTYGETPTSGTGPSTDHTQRNATGKYVYIETSGSRQTGDRAWLISSMHFPTYFTERCLQFWYNMNGPTIGFLSVYMTTHGERPGTLLWRMSGDQGQEWKGVSVELSSLEQYQIIIEGVAGSSCFGDIAIDDMVILPRACQLGEGLMIG